MIISTAPATKVVVGPPSSTHVTVDTPSFIEVSAPTGLPGPPGPPGQDGEDGSTLNSSFIFQQGVPSASWVIVHPLSYYPSITVVDSTGAVVEGDVEYTNANTVTVKFSGAFSGTAYLS